MWLVVDPPEGWRVTEEGELRVARPPDGGGVSIEWSRLRLSREGEEPEATLLGGDVAPPAEVVELDRETLADGWPGVLIEATVEQEYEIREVRLLALYAFHDYRAHALVRAKDIGRYKEMASVLRERLRAGRPDFRGPLVALEEFWE